MREHFNDLMVFLVVTEEKSFTRAAARLGLSQSTVSHTMTKLEKSLGIRLLTRTTRSVAPTDAGERLYRSLAPHVEEMEAEMAALTDMKDKPSGQVRITASDYAYEMVVWPRLSKKLRDYPDIKVEIDRDNGMKNIVAERYDAGVRLGENVEKDMIAVRIGPDWRLVAVCSPDYLGDGPVPATPHELVQHNCINLRMLAHGGMYAWEFEKNGKAFRVRVDGQLTFNSVFPIVDAALEGHGFAFVPESLVKDHVVAGRLVQVLDDWCPWFTGYHLYYPSRRQISPAFQVIIDTLRHRQ